MDENKLTIHTCVVCGTSGTNISLIVVRDENDKVLGAVCPECILKEQARRAKEKENGIQTK